MNCVLRHGGSASVSLEREQATQLVAFLDERGVQGGSLEVVHEGQNELLL